MAAILWNILSPLFVIYLRCSFIEGLVTTIDITVEGNDVFKSGVRQYSVYRSYGTSLTIKCALNTAVEPNEVRLLNNQGTSVPLTTNERTGKFTLEWSKTITVGVRSREKFTCYALFSVNWQSIVNGSQCHSAIYSEVEIEYVTTDQFTAFSVGLSAYLGEQVTITCKGNWRSSNGQNCYRSQQRQPVLIINVPHSNNNIQWESINYDCGYSYTQCTSSLWPSYCSRRPCNLHTDVSIWPTLELMLIPSNFSSNVTTLQFNCTSVPPRLMSWTIITESGDILDFSSSDDIIKVTMNVTITQRPGETVLNISEASAGGNGILSVICSSYDTLAKVSASSHRVFIEEFSDGDTVTVPSTVIVPSTVTVPSSSATVKSTVVNQQGTMTNYKSFHTTEELPTGNTNLPENCVYNMQNNQSSAESMYFKLLLLFVTTISPVVCTLAVVVVILLRKLRLSSIHASPTTYDGNDKEPSETVLHDNPVYQSYSETAGSCLDDAAQNDTCVYANI